jgi:hypothetical protein
MIEEIINFKKVKIGIMLIVKNNTNSPREDWILEPSLFLKKI